MAAFTVGWTPVRRVGSWHSEVAKTATIKSSNCRQELEQQHTHKHARTAARNLRVSSMLCRERLRSLQRKAKVWELWADSNVAPDVGERARSHATHLVLSSSC